MRSRASLKAHPIHPSLIPFPFAFLTGAVLFDIAALAFERPSLGATGAHLTLAGIAAGLVAAVPGAVDYFYTVPPQSSGKKRAAKHGAANVAALLFFGMSWFLRDVMQPTPATVAFELVGALLLLYAGYLGGTLVTRNMISVDHRYANAGKWQELDVSGRAGHPIVVADSDDLKEGQMKLLHVNGERIVLARTAKGYTAFADGCTHRGGSLAGGVLVDRTVHCLWHGSQFDVTTGEVTCGPAKKRIRVYEVKQTAKGQVQLVVPDA